MLSVRVEPARLVGSRFALSRLAELSCALEVLSHPERAPFAAGWVAATQPRFEPADVALVQALVGHGSWYVPDFLVPHPEEYEPTLDDELAAVAATPDDVVRRQISLAFGESRVPGVVAAALDEGLAERAAEELRRCWHAVLAESWPGLRRILDEDVRERAANASRAGFAAILDGLHPDLRWDGAELTMAARYDLTSDAGPGLVLCPSVFLPRPAVWAGRPPHLLLGYPARGRGRMWAAPPAATAPALGPRRIALLADLTVPRSTSELARRHGLSPATVSYHLGRLATAGLVTRRQSGHSVLYAATGRAAALLSAL